ncbi:50S ribosomal protein L23 [Gilvimarinus algae]|uniref:Large ribosomal subunit protein uL23 n=1 Tax=Gilvimarinus algae TaxID=3058037 RepID=A0ABT8TBH4_9GAMM|nr:50S ribosomal protein L23 [Gilvimarinus sp. SDUM040014]MDO3380723.1 50S ribosomal protein L23 [Gilvimarinus sp. SDUM040014]
MNQERIYKILLGPVVSEKAAAAGETGNQVVFKVAADATKLEVKAAVQALFDAKVEQVRILNVKGKTKRTRFGLGKRSDWKKAYVRLEQGQDIDFAVAE